MSLDPKDVPNLSNNLVLRQLQGVRREMQEMMERQARTIELVNRLALRMDENFTRLRDDAAHMHRDINTIRSDLVLMENKILNGQQDILRMVMRLDETGEAVPEPPEAPLSHG